MYYTYRTTFKDLPGFFYYGYHKDDGRPYCGSPKTWAHLWEQFEPEVQILQWYETKKEAKSAEDAIILHTWRSKYSLNESVGPMISEEICRSNGRRTGGNNFKNANNHPRVMAARRRNGEKSTNRVSREKSIEGGRTAGKESYENKKGVHAMPFEERSRLAYENIAGHNRKRVRCIETGETYSSCVEAALSVGSNPVSLRRACRKGRRSGGFTWEFVG